MEVILDLTINGKKETINDCKTLYQLLIKKNVVPSHVVCELNGEIIDESEFQNTVLNDGMKIELIAIVGGG